MTIVRVARRVSTRLPRWPRVGFASAGVLASVLAVAACDSSTATANEAEDPEAPTLKRVPTKVAKAQEEEAAAEGSLAPLRRADKRMAFPARGGTNLGYNLATLEKLRALAGAVEIPEWSAPHSSNARALRDDDIATAWTCTPSSSSTCAAGLHFPEAATVRAVRLFGAAASGPGAYEDHPRVKKVRIHTDEGWAEAMLPDEPTHGYVVLGKEVTTRTLVLEVLGLHGEEDGELHLGELEVYGSSGVAREPWDIDPARVVVRQLDAPWSVADRRHRTGEAYLGILDAHGASTLLMRGTALYGNAGDRLLLAEVLDDTTCEHHRGQFYLVDQQTRVIAPIGDLGGIGADAYRSREGLGFAHGKVDDHTAELAGVLLEDASYERRRTQRRSTATPAETLAEWKLDATPLVRGGSPINREIDGCKLGGDASIAVLTGATAREPVEKPAEWMVCELAEHVSAYVTDHGPCGASWEIVVLSDGQRVVAQKSAKRKGARARLRRVGLDAVLVEIGGDDDKTELYRIDRTGIVGPIAGTALAISPPDACRSRCDAPLLRED